MSLGKSTDGRDERVDAIIADYLEAERTGRAPDREQLVKEHPDLACELRSFFADRERFVKLAGPLRADEAKIAVAAQAAALMPTLAPGDAPAAAPGELLRYFGDYELLEEIARGGMGVVFKARQKRLNRIVAVKMILAGKLAGQADVERFHVEAQAAANLQHPNIVAIHEVGEHEGQHYFSMDYVEGTSLAALVRENPLPARKAARYVEQVSEAIEYAHCKGTIHRDIKPSNVLIDTVDQPRITDFGLAKRIKGDSALTGTGQALGTPSYMPPEQAAGDRGEVGPASDVYSLGAVLYELLVGRPPFRAETPLDTLLQVLDVEPVSPRLLNPKVPKDLETITLKCLQKSARSRYARAAELAADLRRFLDGDGEPEVVLTAPWAGAVIAVSPYSKRTLWWHRPTDDGAHLVDQPCDFDADQPIALDADGDTRPDLLTVFASSGKAWIEALSGLDGRSLWRFDFESSWVVSSPGRANWPTPMAVLRDGDGTTLMVVVGKHVIGLELTTGRAVWPPRLLPFMPLWECQWADLDDDGRQELIVVHGPPPGTITAAPAPAARLSAISLPDFKTLWRADLSSSAQIRMQGAEGLHWPFTARLGVDGKPVIAVAAEFATPHGTWDGMELLDGATGKPCWSRRLWPRRTNRTPANNPQSDIARLERFLEGPDLDGDGHRELIVASVGPLPTDLGLVQVAKGLGEERIYLCVEALSGLDGRTLSFWSKPGLQRFMVRSLAWWQGDPEGGLQLAIGNSTRAMGIHDIYPPRLDVISIANGQTRHVGQGEFLPRIADLNGDGIGDLLSIGPPESRFGQGHTRKVAAIAGTPPVAWRRFGNWRPAEDYDGDGVREWIAADFVSETTPYLVAGRDGRLMPREPVSWPRSAVVGHQFHALPPEHGDLDGDHVPELLVAAPRFLDVYRQRPGGMPILLQALSGRTGRKLWSAGDVSLETDGSQADIQLNLLSPFCDALEANGPHDVFCPYWLIHRGSPNLAQFGLARLSGNDGTVVWGAKLSDKIDIGGLNEPAELGFRPAYIPVNLDADGIRDMLLVIPTKSDANFDFALQAVDGRDGTVLWRRAIKARPAGGFDTPPVPLAADIDGDGHDEVVIVEYTSRPDRIEYEAVVLAAATGEPKWTRPWVTSGAHRPFTRPFLADLAGNGTRAVCLALYERVDDQGASIAEIVVLDPRGQVRARAPGGPHLVAGDLDGDGRDELVFADGAKVRAVGGDLVRTLWDWTLPGGQNVMPREILPASDGRRTIVVVADAARGTLIGLDGPSGRVLWRGEGPTGRGTASTRWMLWMSNEPRRNAFEPWLLDTEASDRQRSGGAALWPLPRLGGAPGMYSASLLAMPANQDGKCMVELPGSTFMPGQVYDPRWLRPLPWVHPSDQWVTLLRFVFTACAVSIGAVVVPGAWLWWAIRHRTWSIRFLLLLPIAIGIAFVTCQWAFRSRQFADFPDAARAMILFGQAFVGLPTLAFAMTLTLWTVRCQWRKLLFLAFSILLLSLLWGAVCLWIDGRDMDPAQHYSWQGWPLVGLVGGFLSGMVCLAGFVLGPPVRAAWRGLRRMFAKRALRTNERPAQSL